MKQLHGDLALMNREIMRDHTIRVQNHKDLVESLKEINIIIQRASNLRGNFLISYLILLSNLLSLINSRNIQDGFDHFLSGGNQRQILQSTL